MRVNRRDRRGPSIAILARKSVQPIAIELADDRRSTFELSRRPLAGEAVGGTVDFDQNRLAERALVGDCQGNTQTETILGIDGGTAGVERPAIDSHEAEITLEAGFLEVAMDRRRHVISIGQPDEDSQSLGTGGIN